MLCLNENIQTIEDPSYVENKKRKIVNILIFYFLITVINFVLVVVSASYTYTHHHSVLFVVTIISALLILPYLIFVMLHIRIIKLSTILLNAYTLKAQFIKCSIYTNIKSVINILLLIICCITLGISLNNKDLNDQLVIVIYSYFLGLSTMFICVDRYIYYQLNLIKEYIDKMHPHCINDTFLE
jgi:hypothetical protein